MWKWLLGFGGLLVYLVGEFGHGYASPVWIVLGFVVGYILDGRNDPRIEPLLKRISQLEALVGELGARLVQLEGRSPATPVTTVAEPAASAVPAQPAVAAPVALDLPMAETASVQPEAVEMLELPPESPATAQPVQPSPQPVPAYQPPKLPQQPRPPRKPPEPDIFERAFAAARGWLFGGNTVVRFGILILFFGVGFLIKYAAEHSLVPVELRLAGVAAGAVALLVIGWRLVESRRGYALILQGGGVGMLYLTAFGAVKLYHLLPAGLALGLMVAFCGFSAFLAIRQDARSLAVVGSIGGFLAPILTSTGGGNHVMLFSYYALLNAGIFAIAWFKAWRPLNLVGFFFTFGIGAAWGAQSYVPELFASTEPFLVLFFLFYVAIAVLYARQQSTDTKPSVDIKHVVDSTLVFGTPLVAFGFQARLVSQFEFGLAFSAVVLAALYLGLAGWLLRQRVERLRLPGEAFFALGVIFATLAIPLALDARWTSAAWALEGAAAVWAALRQNRRLPLIFGLLLQLAAGVSLTLDTHTAADVMILNHRCVGGALLALSWLFSAWRLQKAEPRTPWRQVLSYVFAVLGLLAWLANGADEIERQHWAEMPSWLWLLLGTAWLASLARTRLAWPAARWPALLLPVALLWLGLIDAGRQLDQLALAWWGPLVGWAGLAWLVAVVSGWGLLKRHDAETPAPLAAVLHAILVAGAVLLVASQAGDLVAGWLPQSDWATAIWAAAIAAALFGLATRAKAIKRWPFTAHEAAYRLYAGGFWALLAAGWSLYAAAQSGIATPLPYLPVLNPVDLATAFSLLALWRWSATLTEVDDPRIARGLLAALVFVWLNAMLLRTLHHWAAVPWDGDALARSTLVQAALSIFWSVIALAVMFTATRQLSRLVWFVGAVLLAVVVGKLFLIDLSHLTGVTRIVSFIGVGVLLLLIGYLSPLPPVGKPENMKS